MSQPSQGPTGLAPGRRFTKTGAVDFDDVAADLYALAPGRFTASRDARAAEARAAGDRALAERIKELRRPTVSAWLGNQLAHERPQDIEGLIGLGTQLREAQAGLAGEELRRLSRRRGDAVDALVAQAKDVARKEGQSVSDAVLEEVTATIEAALADPAAAEALRSGRLTVALHYSGLGLEVSASAPGVEQPAGCGRTSPDAPHRCRRANDGRPGAPPSGRRTMPARRLGVAREGGGRAPRRAATLGGGGGDAAHAPGGGSRGGAAGDPCPQGAPSRARRRCTNWSGRPSGSSEPETALSQALVVS